MKKILEFLAPLIVLVPLFLCIWSGAHKIADSLLTVAERIEDHTVHIQVGETQGSGTIFIENFCGVDEYFILTAAHVVDGAYEPIEIRRQIRNLNGVYVGESYYEAEVLICDTNVDIAILYVGQMDGVTSAQLDRSGDPPRLGTSIYHCGSPNGEEYGYNSVTQGIVSQTGKFAFWSPTLEAYFDQVSCAIIGGSSGGGVYYAENGVYLGIVSWELRGCENINYIIPARLILDWAEENRFLWLFIDAHRPHPEKFNPGRYTPR